MNKMKYFILLASLVSTCQSGCPSMCNCSSSAVLCVEKNLESIPSFESLLNDPLIIDLSGNKIGMVDSDDFSFDKSDKVLEVYLNNTELSVLDGEAFDELENLQELYLGENLLNDIPESIIEDLPNMVLLDISNNHFSGGMPKIISKSLEVLAVANSKITSLPVDSLKYLPNLKMLLLQQNNIKSIDPAVFDSVDKSNFFVKLSYNVWDCSCENIRLFEYLAGKKFIDSSEPYQCLANTGTYINIFENGNMESLKQKCANDATEDLPTYKEHPFIIQAEEQLKEEEKDSHIENEDKPYSLVKEHITTSTDDPMYDYDNDILEYDSYDNYTAEEYADMLWLNRDIYEEEEMEAAKFEEAELSKVNFNLNIGTFIAVIGSFIIGVILGFCLNQLATMMRYRKLETSDSRTKLILP